MEIKAAADRIKPAATRSTKAPWRACTRIGAQPAVEQNNGEANAADQIGGGEVPKEDAARALSSGEHPNPRRRAAEEPRGRAENNPAKMLSTTRRHAAAHAALRRRVRQRR